MRSSEEVRKPLSRPLTVVVELVVVVVVGDVVVVVFSDVS